MEAAIARITEWRGRPLSYQRIDGGITNLNWKVFLEDERRNYFMKLPGAGTEVFIDRATAFEAAVKAAAAGVGPQVLHHIEDEGIEVHEFLEGYRSCNVGDLLDKSIRSNVALALKAVHETQTLSRKLTGFDQLDLRLGLALQHGARLPPDLETLLWQCDRARRAIEAAGMPLAACFNDAYVTNYMVDAQHNVKIIDWEYASNNDPHWDLAVFACETFLGEEGLREMIETHDGRHTDAAEARINLYIGVAGVVWSLWAALQARISTIPFDFAKYSELLFLRTRHAIAHPRWEEALVAL
ncbi:MAG: choline/ethanolamine kinase family protein [Burkholderiaceae bacterium]